MKVRVNWLELIEEFIGYALLVGVGFYIVLVWWVLIVTGSWVYYEPNPLMRGFEFTLGIGIVLFALYRAIKRAIKIIKAITGTK
jgi:hypothetical protein